MKNLILFLFLVSSNVFSQNLKKHELLIPYRDGNMWGLCDTLGVVKVKPFADDLVHFRIFDDLSGKYIVKKEGKISVIDEKKNFLLENSKYDSVSISSFDRAIEVYKNKKIGVFLNGKELIPCNYDRIHKVHNASYEVQEKNLKGLINSEGKVIIPLKYESIDSYYDENYFKNGKFTWIAKRNSTKTKFFDKKIEIKEVSPPSIGMSEVYEKVSNPDSVNLYNQKIEEIKKEYTLKQEIKEKFLIVKKNNKYGLIEIYSKRLILDCLYDSLNYETENKNFSIFQFTENNKYGFVDENGKVILKDLEDIFNYNHSIYFIKKDEKWGVKIFNTVYDVILPKYNSIDLFDTFSVNENWSFNLFKITTLDGKVGYIGENGVEYFKD